MSDLLTRRNRFPLSCRNRHTSRLGRPLLVAAEEHAQHVPGEARRDRVPDLLEGLRLRPGDGVARREALQNESLGDGQADRFSSCAVSVAFGGFVVAEAVAVALVDLVAGRPESGVAEDGGRRPIEDPICGGVTEREGRRGLVESADGRSGVAAGSELPLSPGLGGQRRGRLGLGVDALSVVAASSVDPSARSTSPGTSM